MSPVATEELTETVQVSPLRRRIINRIAELDISWKEAAQRLNISRQTLYQWCGPRSFQYPQLERYREIAGFLDEDPRVVRDELLRAHGIIRPDEVVVDSAIVEAATLTPRNNAIPGYINWAESWVSHYLVHSPLSPSLSPSLSLVAVAA